MGRNASTLAGAGTVAAAVAAAWLASLAGLLFIPLDLYDEPALAMGGRIVRAGGLPYLDFYTHYGPLGYSLMALFLGIGNPGIAYRLAQASALALVAVLLVPLASRLSTNRLGAPALAGLLLLNFSCAIVFAQFLGFLFVLVALEAVSVGELSPSTSSSETLWVVAGAALGLAGLVRPAFAAYGVVSLAGFAVVARSGLRLARLFAAAAGAAGLVWLLLYRPIPLEEAWFAMIVIPGKLTGGLARFLSPSLLPRWFGSAAQGLFGAAHLAVLFALATTVSLTGRDRRARAIATFGIGAAAATPFVVRSASQPGRAAAIAALVLFAVAIASFLVGGVGAFESPSARVSVLFGLAAIVFLHYYLSRADRAHVTASLVLAATAGAAQLPRLMAAGRASLSLLLSCSVLPLFFSPIPFPAYWIGHAPSLPVVSTATGRWTRFPASAFPESVVAAVAQADREASPSSRFVALATDHGRTEGSAVVLFLLSARMPYTRWYSYDPGVQSSPFVQAEMIRELERSGSSTAVTWRSEAFQGLPETMPPRTPLDRRVRDLYGRVVGTYGDLEVRGRS